jgi:hypothetical protein
LFRKAFSFLRFVVLAHIPYPPLNALSANIRLREGLRNRVGGFLNPISSNCCGIATTLRIVISCHKIAFTSQAPSPQRFSEVTPAQPQRGPYVVALAALHRAERYDYSSESSGVV